jgi:hypothetical protein
MKKFLVNLDYLNWGKFCSEAPINDVAELLDFCNKEKIYPRIIDYVIKNKEFSTEFLEKYKEDFSWLTLSSHLPMSPEDITKFADKIFWKELLLYNSSFETMGLENFKLIPKNIYLDKSYYAVFGFKIPEDILQYILDNISFSDQYGLKKIIHAKNSITQSFMLRNFEKLKDQFWDVLSSNASNFNEEFFKEEKVINFIEEKRILSHWNMDEIIRSWKEIRELQLDGF